MQNEERAVEEEEEKVNDKQKPQGKKKDIKLEDVQSEDVDPGGNLKLPLTN